jgi:CHASE3 domain sensor protein
MVKINPKFLNLLCLLSVLRELCGGAFRISCPKNKNSPRHVIAQRSIAANKLLNTKITRQLAGIRLSANTK